MSRLLEIVRSRPPGQAIQCGSCCPCLGQVHSWTVVSATLFGRFSALHRSKTGGMGTNPRRSRGHLGNCHRPCHSSTLTNIDGGQRMAFWSSCESLIDPHPQLYPCTTGSVWVSDSGELIKTMERKGHAQGLDRARIAHA